MIPHLLTPAILSALGFFGAAGAVVAGGFCAADDRASGAGYGGCTDEIIGGGLVGSRIHKHEPWSHR